MAPVGVSGFLVHRDGDSVGVAVTDLTPGPVRGSSLSNPDISISIEVTEPIPLGHKLAITTIGQGQQVVEYGACVAVAIREIAVGQLVHVHNVRSARWAASIQS